MKYGINNPKSQQDDYIIELTELEASKVIGGKPSQLFISVNYSTGQIYEYQTDSNGDLQFIRFYEVIS